MGVALTLVLCLLAGSAYSQSLSGRDIWLNERIFEIRKEMTLEHYDKAIGLIKKLLPVCNKKRKKRAHYNNARAYCFFQRGFANMELGHYDQAVKYFKKYISDYPRFPDVFKARLLWADALAAQKKWEEVIKLVEPLKRSKQLDSRERMALYQLLAEAYFALEKWEQAVNPFLYVYRHTYDDDIRMHANISLTVCLIRLERFEAIFQVLPRIFRTSARFSFVLNMALLDESDRLYKADKRDIAVMLYRLISSKSEILDYLEQRERRLDARIAALEQAGTGVGKANAKREIRRLQREKEQLEKDRKEVDSTPDYEAEVMIRVANCYFSMERYYSAKEVFRLIFEQFPENELAERALYSLFTVEYAMQNIESAIAEGEKYIDKYRGGEFWEALSLNIAMLHLERDELQAAVDMATTALSLDDNRSKAQLHYIRGYALFNLDRVEDALKDFEVVAGKHGDSPFAEPAAYWHAMSRMFMGRNRAAIEEFRTFRSKYLGGAYYEDASYRIGVAHYQLGENRKAEELLRDFLDRFPDSNLRSEAAALLGSILASEGRLDGAVEMFAAAAESGVNMVQVNYAVFEAARTLELEDRFEDIERLFQNYLDEWGAQGNVTEAIYWLGKAKMGRGDREGALKVYFDGIMQYGNDPRAYGIDMIIKDLVDERKQSNDARYLAFMKSLFDKIDTTREDGRATLNYRLLTMFALTKEKNDPTLVGLVETFLRDRVIEIAAPITLALMGQKAKEVGRPDFARKVYEHFLENYPDSDCAIDALKGMADINIEEGDYDQAREYLEQISSRFPMLPDAGWAQVRIGDIYRNRGEYGAGIDAYNLVLSVKEWRGEIWAESLYKIGLCHLDQGDVREAFAFFQRMYVMYAGYPEWAAKGYLKSAECLLRLNLRVDAVKTYRELLAQENMQDTPQAEIARRKLKELGVN